MARPAKATMPLEETKSRKAAQAEDLCYLRFLAALAPAALEDAGLAECEWAAAGARLRLRPVPAGCIVGQVHRWRWWDCHRLFRHGPVRCGCWSLAAISGDRRFGRSHRVLAGCDPAAARGSRLGRRAATLPNKLGYCPVAAFRWLQSRGSVRRHCQGRIRTAKGLPLPARHLGPSRWPSESLEAGRGSRADHLEAEPGIRVRARRAEPAR